MNKAETTAPPAASAEPESQSADKPVTIQYDRPRPRSVKDRNFRSELLRTQREKPVSLSAVMVDKLRQMRSLDFQTREQHARDIATFFQYFDGNEYGEFDESGQWVSDAMRGFSDELQYSFPIVPAHVDSAKTMLLKTDIQYEYEPKEKDSVLDAQLAKMCQELAEEDVARIFTEDKRTYEILYLLLAGKSYRHVYWSKNEDDPETCEIPVYSTESVEVPGYRVCGKCGYKLGAEDAICSKCLSNEIVTIGGGATVKGVTHSETITLGENQLHIPNPLSIQHDLSKRNLNNSFLIERDSLPRAEAEFLYSQLFNQSNRQDISPELRMMRELERLRLRTTSSADETANVALRSLFSGDGAGETDLVERERAWLQPWRYAHIMITEDKWFLDKVEGLIWCESAEEVPRTARPVKPGTFLGDIFPHGAFVCIVDEALVEMSPDRLQEKWLKLIFGARPANSDGAGMRRLRPLADMSNDATNLEFKILMDDANPQTFINRKYLQMLGQVGEYNLVDSLGETDDWTKVVHRLQGASAHPDLSRMNEKVQAMAQFLSGTFSSLGAGAPDIKAAGTATGVAAMTEEAAGRFLEAILQIKLADILMRYILLKNRQAKSIDTQVERLKKRFGSAVTKRFLSCKLRDVIAIKAKKGTDAPKSQALSVAMMQAYSQAASQLVNHPQGVSILEQFAEDINLPLRTGIGLADKEEAARRIGLLREFCAKFYEKDLPVEQVVGYAIGAVTRVIEMCESEMPIIGDQSLPAEEMPTVAPSPQLALPPGEPPATAMPPDQEAIAGEPVFNDVPAPSAGMPPQPQPEPVSSVVMMQEHAVFMDAYKDFILTEGARCENKVLSAAVQMMWKLHFERENIKRKQSVRLETEAMLEGERAKAEFQNSMMPPAPSPDQIAAMKNAESDAASEANNAAEETEIVKELGRRALDEEGKDRDAERSERAKDEDLRRDLARADHQHKLDKEKLNAAGEKDAPAQSEAATDNAGSFD